MVPRKDVNWPQLRTQGGKPLADCLSGSLEGRDHGYMNSSLFLRSCGEIRVKSGRILCGSPTVSVCRMQQK